MGFDVGIDAFFAELTNWVLPIFIVFVAVMSMVFIKDRAWIKLLSFTGIAAVVGIFAFAGPNLFGPESQTETTATREESQPEIEDAVEEEADNEEPTQQEPSEPLDWQPLIYLGTGVLGILVLAGVAAVGIAGVNSIRSSKKSKREEKERLKSQWKNVRDRHTEARATVAKYETDIMLAIDYPAMHDVTVEETSEMIQASRDAQEIEAETKKHADIGGDNLLLKDYRNAVDEFVRKVELAEINAKRLQWNNVSVAEQKDLKQAKFLFKHASDPGNTKEARASYMARLKEIVDRINDRHKSNIIPTATISLIENESRLLLTDGNENKTEQVNIVNTEEQKTF